MPIRYHRFIGGTWALVNFMMTLDEVVIGKLNLPYKNTYDKLKEK